MDLPVNDMFGRIIDTALGILVGLAAPGTWKAHKTAPSVPVERPGLGPVEATLSQLRHTLLTAQFSDALGVLIAPALDQCSINFLTRSTLLFVDATLSVLAEAALSRFHVTEHGVLVGHGTLRFSRGGAGRPSLALRLSRWHLGGSLLWRSLPQWPQQHTLKEAD